MLHTLFESTVLKVQQCCLIYTDAPSYSHRDVTDILSTDEEEKKKRMYCDASEVRCASFTSVVSVGGVLGRETEFFVKLLADKMDIQK